MTASDYDRSEPPEGGASPNGFQTEETDAWCTAAPSPAPYATYTYHDGGAQGYTLKIDEYYPLATLYPAPYPIMILVHGGGFARGCRWSMDGPAYKYANDGSLSKHFISLSIDYRLACSPTDSTLSGQVKAQNLCGWRYNDPDPAHSNAPGSAIHDVQDAIQWVRTQWSSQSGHGGTWNGKIAVLGGSGGGNLSFMASILWPPTQGTGPDALAALSPFPRFTQYFNPNTQQTTWTCGSGETDDVDICAIGYPEQGGTVNEGGINRYLPCSQPGNNQYQPGCVDRYTAAGPYDQVQNNLGGLPAPTFVANGGGPTPGSSPPEPAALLPAQQYTGLLFSKGVAQQMCTVNQPDHGTHLLGDHCNTDPTLTVRQQVDLFLVAYVCDVEHPCGG